MNILLATWAILGLLAQDEPEGAAPSDPERIGVLVIHATNEGRGTVEFDPTLSSLEDYLAELPYDTFRELGFHEALAPYAVETAVEVQKPYTLYFQPNNVSDSSEVLFDAHLDVTEEDSTLQALKVSGRAARGQGIVLRGLPMPEGELMVVISIAKSSEQGGGQARGSQQSQGAGGAGSGQEEGGGIGQQNQDADQTQDSLSQEMPSPPDPEEEMPRADQPRGHEQREQQEQLPPELANIEGILRALEEQDIREQQNARNRRYEVVIQGDWW